jgi:hypothetical protein
VSKRRKISMGDVPAQDEVPVSRPPEAGTLETDGSARAAEEAGRRS